MDAIFVEIIGFGAGFLMAITMLPQIIKSLKTKSVDDISTYMLLAYALSSLLWVVYGILIQSMPVAITDGFAFCMVSIQIFIKIKYAKESSKTKKAVKRIGFVRLPFLKG
jgi:MtN3 and saliva related transmembrane protein